MLQNLTIEPPHNGEEFERWCLELARAKYGPEVFQYKRKKQYGIDIYWLQRGKYVVIQCKQRANPDTAELIRSLEKDFAVAQQFFATNLKQFIFASTITLEQACKKVTRANGNSESLLDAIGRLGSDHNVTVVCWHWDGISQDISDSPWLMARLLGLEKGGELIDEEFLAEQHKKHGHDSELKQAYYSGKKAVQWCGIVQQLDSPRLAYEPAKQAITNSFSNTDAVAALIKGDGGSGKSVLLRRLAHDLCGDYCVYWLESSIQSFLDCEWVYDLSKHGKTDTPPKYLIFLEDWYQHVDNSSQLKEAAELLAKVSNTSYVRLVIGDRIAKPGSKKAYDAQVSRSGIFELRASENLRLLENIFTNMPAWREKADIAQIKKAANASLFQLLFIFQYAEDLTGTIAEIYQRIIVSDYRALLERSLAFWQGMAKALYFYANLYTEEGITLTLEFLRDLAAYFADCTIPRQYSLGIEALANDMILKKYLGLDIVNTKYSGTSNRFRFHHDTMADNGWRRLGYLFYEQYDEAMLQTMLKYFQNDYIWIVGKIYTKRIMQPGNKGMEAARTYLNLNHPENDRIAFTRCLKKFRNEAWAKNKAWEFLKTKKKPWQYFSVFTVCLDLFKNDELAKDLVQNKTREFLGTDKPWEIQETFFFCLDLLKNEPAGIDKAVFILENRKQFNAGHHWSLLYHSLLVLHDQSEHKQLVTQAANEIIANRNNMGYRHGQLFKIPLFDVPQWLQSTEHSIRNWYKLNNKNPQRPWINRNALYSITISYKKKPELLEAMCLGMIRNWRFELRIQQKHQAYFIRCLAHPAIQRNGKLRQEIIAICKEILHDHTQPSRILNEGTRFWLQNIVENNLFPEWDFESDS